MGKQGVRRPVIAGNWKMHMTCAQSREFMEAFLPLIADTPDDRDLHRFRLEVLRGYDERSLR